MTKTLHSILKRFADLRPRLPFAGIGTLEYREIRLVIWDLDETFWGGTLTEGGIAYHHGHHAIVIELCRRGIMSSICSKNDHDAVKDILVKSGLWEYFIFPSIDWSPKASRIIEIVKAVQLRPETVLFVDDHPGNRAEAKAALPGLHVADETVIRKFRKSRGFVGKADAELTRLQQYKLLETRHAAERASGGDNIEFLRQSGIKVTLIPDVAQHIDRAVELITRTNQLNFTKQRLPEDKAEATKQLLEQISHYHVRAGLVSVRDRYGDHGICGFFLLPGLLTWGTPRLHHFCFSCRVLGMGVEQWVYEVLGRPPLHIIGEVVSDLTQKVDWINTSSDRSDHETERDEQFGEVRIRGGCELEVLEHYFRAHARTVITEVNAVAAKRYMPRQHSAILSAAARGLGDDQIHLIAPLGMDRSFYDTKLFDACDEGTLIILSLTGDGLLTMYRHKETAFHVSVWFREFSLPSNPSRTEEEKRDYEAANAYLQDAFEAVPFDDTAKYRENYEAILSEIPPQALLVVILPNYLMNHDGRAVPFAPQVALNDAFKAAAKDHPNVEFIEMASLLKSIDEVTGHHLHFNSAVHHRLYQEICTRYRGWRGRQRAPSRTCASVGN